MRAYKGIILALLLLRGLSAEAQTPLVLLQPKTQRIDVVSSATVWLAGNGVQVLHAYSVRITYDPLLLRCVAVQDKGFLGPMVLFFPTVNNQAGEIRADAALLGPGGVSGSGNLLEMKFEGVRSGTSLLRVMSADLRDTASTPIAVQTQDREILVGDVDGVASAGNMDAAVLQAGSYPNPFNSSTTITIRAGYGTAAVSIYSILGTEVFHREMQSRAEESSTFVWDARDRSGAVLPSGVYVLRVESGGRSACARLMLLK